MKTGCYDEAQREEQLAQRGFMNRFLGRLTKTVTRPRGMYPIGLLFGLGFDTATEVALLVLAGGAAGAELPWYAILCLPVLFAAGMSLMDAVCQSPLPCGDRDVVEDFADLVIGTIELGGLIASQAEPVGILLERVREHQPQPARIRDRRHVHRGLGDRADGVALGRIEKRWSLHLSTSAKSE
jgi:High-affinity nickel-transport protein